MLSPDRSSRAQPWASFADLWRDSLWIGLPAIHADDLHPLRVARWLRPSAAPAVPTAQLGIARDFELSASDHADICRAELHFVRQGRDQPWLTQRAWVSVNGRTRDNWRDNWDLRSPLTIDIAAELRAGANRVALRGWADHDAALIALVEIEFANGLTWRLPSDATWQARNWPTDDDEPGWDTGPAWSRAVDAGAWTAGPWAQEHWARRVAARRAPAVLRRRFELARPAMRAYLHITACGLYLAELDGRRVGDHEQAPGFTDYRTRIDAQTFELGPLAEGPHELGATLADGWFCGRIFLGRRAWGDEASLRAVLIAEHADGGVTRIATDTAWEGTTGPLRASCLFEGEETDLRRAPGPWRPVKVVQPDVPLPTPATHPPVRVVAEVSAITIRPAVDAGRQLIDFGQNLAGRVRLVIVADQPTTVRLHHAEVLDLQGRLFVEALRSARSIDTFHVPAGRTVLEPRFAQHGFRYAEVEGPVRIESAHAQVLTNDLPVTGDFACSDERINRFHACIRWGEFSNVIGIPTDCPQRDERAGWSDAQNQWPTWCLLRDHSDFLASFADAWFALQKPNGALPDYAPQPFELIKGADVDRSRFAWGCTGVQLPHLLWLNYGRLDVAGKHWSGILRYLEHRRAQRPEEVERWAYGDWLSVGTPTPLLLLDHAYFAYTLRLASELAAALGRSAEAEELASEFAASSARWSSRWAPDGLTPTQTAAVVALNFGLLPPAHIAPAVAQLAEKAFAEGLTSGYIGAGRILQTLHDHGRTDAAWRLALRTTAPGWLAMVENGATTLWERWDSYDPVKGPANIGGMNSYNHTSFGAYGEWLYRVAGLRQAPGSTAWRHVVADPSPGPLTHARARYRSASGEWSSAWERRDNHFRWTFSVPEGCRADARLPGSTEFRPLGPGTHALECALA